MALKWNEIRVDKKIESIPHDLRKPVYLSLGGEYYVSLKKNIAIKCRLVKIFESSEGEQMVLLKYHVSQSGGYDGEISVFFDEIGTSPEEAVMYSMFS